MTGSANLPQYNNWTRDIRGAVSGGKVDVGLESSSQDAEAADISSQNKSNFTSHDAGQLKHVSVTTCLAVAKDRCT